MANLNTPYATLAFPSLYKSRPRFEGSEKMAYQCVLIFTPAAQQSPAYKAMQDAVIEAAKKTFGEQVKLNALTLPFKDAGEKAGQWNGFDEGCTYIKVWSESKPGVVDAQRQDILLPEEVWAGQKVRANVTAGAWNNSGKRGVSFYLNHIQVISSDGPRIDGKAAPSKAFDDGVVFEDADIPF
jgi:hypothetical protein